MPLTPEEIEALAAEMLKQQKAAEAENTPAPKSTPEPQDPPQNQGFDVNAVVSELTKVFDERNTNQQNEAMSVLFDQQLEQAKSIQPGFGDFLEQTDDYGNVRKDNLTKIEDYKKRTETLSQLQDSFAEAAANTPGRKPVVNTRERQIATDINDKYEDVWKRWDNGEITSEQQLAEEHAKIMSEEAATLTGGGSQ